MFGLPLLLVFMATFLQTGDHERTEHWHTRYQLFISEADSVLPGRIIFLGNSITEGFDLNIYFPDIQPVNRGISGDHTDGLLERLQDSVIRLRPSKLFVLIGINDIGAGYLDATILDNYRKLMNRISEQLPATEVFIQSILPASAAWTNCPREKIDDLNSTLHQYTQHFQFIWIDLHTVFRDSNGYLKQVFTDDGLHLNQTGYEQWTEILQSYIY